MKKLFSSILILASLAQGNAQQLDIVSQAMLRRANIAEANPAVRLRAKANSPSGETPIIALVKLQDGAKASDLAADGFDVKPLRGGFATVTCPTSEALRLSRHKAIKRCEFNRQRTFSMDKAREASGISILHSGLDLPQAFTGNGVVTGIVDGGFDPNHINFKDAEGNSRFKYFATCDISSANQVRVTPYTPEALLNFTTDDNTQTHGTHTLGIMAGSFMGDATVGIYNEQTDNVTVSETANPYYGVAYNSTLYASSGASYDALIAYAIDGMLEHRYYNDHEAPMVINLSLGGNQGPHDGTGILSQYIDQMAVSDNAIFCVSSGNEGDMPIAYHKTFTDGDNSFATFIRPYAYTDMRYGMIEFYSDTAEDFDVSIILYNKARKKVALTFPMNNKEGQIQYICSGANHQQDETDIIDKTLAKAYEGYIGVGGMLDEESGRFYAAIDYYLVNSDENPADPTTTEAQYTIGFLIKGKDGQRVDAFCDGQYTALDSYGYEGYVDGMRNGSISDMATGKNIIVVGSYNTKEWGGSIYGQALGYDGYFKKGEITEFTSFGTLVDGRNLPHLVAPGCLVVSSMSTPYFNNPANGISDQITSVKYNDGKRDNYFYPMMGTSMAAPVVAGTVALMLEANPTLTFDKVREILTETATMDDAVEKIEDPVQMGAGKLNALAAVKAVLNSDTGVRDITTTGNRLMLTPTGQRTFNVFLANANRIDVAMYNASGVKVLSAASNGDQLDIDASGMAPGVYLLTVNNGKAQRIIVK